MFERFKAEKRLRVLEERHDDLERQFKALELDWSNTYDKLRSIVQRISKRAERLEGLAAGSAEETGGAGASMADELSPTARAAQREIELRRRRSIPTEVKH